MAKVDRVLGLPVTMFFVSTVLLLQNVFLIKSDEVDLNDIITSSFEAEILNSMNTSVDPCDDFYDYACQGWSEKNPRPDYTPSWNVFKKLDTEVLKSVIDILENPISDDDFPALVQAKQFYRKCVNIHEETEESSGLQAILNVLDEFGGWPILHDQRNWNSSKFDWINSTAGLKRMFSGTAFLEAMPFEFPSWTNITNTIILLPPPELSDSVRGLARTIDTSVLSVTKVSNLQLKHLIVNISKAFLEFQGKTNINETYLEEIAEKILTVDSDLFYMKNYKNDFWSTIKKCIDSFQCGSCNLMSLDEIQHELVKYYSPGPNKLDIKSFLKALFADDFIYFKKALVIDFEYLRELGIYLSFLRTDERIANYLHFQMVLKMIPLTGNKYLNDLITNLDSATLNVTEKMERNMVCASETKNKFYYAIGQAYVDLRGNVEKEFEIIADMYKQIKNSVGDLMKKYVPSPYATTLKALESETLRTHLCLGYPSWMKENSSSKLQSLYTGLELNQSESFFSQNIAFNLWHTRFDLDSYKKLVSDVSQGNYCIWTFFPGTVNAYNTITHNLAYIPLGIIQPPFFNTQLSMAKNYGKFGSILGQEIVHGLVVPHLLELKRGGLTPLGECMWRHYNRYVITDEGIRFFLPGKRSLRETLSDGLGLLAAYKVFKAINWPAEIDTNSTGLKQFTNEQLFFLGFAQTYCDNSTMKSQRYSMQYSVPWHAHPPSKFRVLGTLRNIKEFSKAWNCSVGSKMNLEDTVTPYRLWKHPKCF